MKLLYSVGSRLLSLSAVARKAVVLVGVSLGVFLTSTVVLAVLLARERINRPTADDEICLSAYCIKAGDLQIIFEILDRKVDESVVDLLSTTLPNDTARLRSVISARALYQSCLDESHIDNEGIDPILSLVNSEFGGWPILQGPSWDSAMFNLRSLLLKLRQYNYNVIFSVATSFDDRNSSAKNIVVGQGRLGLPQRQYYAEETNVTAAYRLFMSSLARSLTNETAAIDQDVRDMFEFEKNISRHHWTPGERRARSNETVRTTLSNLSSVLQANFDFVGYLRDAYLLANVTLDGADPVSVGELQYLMDVSSILVRTPVRILQNYFVWHFMMSQAENMPRHIRSVREQFVRVFRGTNAERTRTIKCAAYVNEKMSFVVSKLYIQKYFDEEARSQSVEIIKYVRDSFIDMLRRSSWMDEESKAQAIEKAQAINEKIGYPDYLASGNNTKLEEDYAAYVFNSSYIRNVLRIHRIKTVENFQFLRLPVDRNAWLGLPPSFVNANYQQHSNQIVFPAAILQTPFFNKDAPKYLNYGSIGMVIGHEITHGFDDRGRQFNKDGNRIAWWTNATIENFNARKKCIIEQYDNYTVSQIGKNSNGNQTQGENIADNGGLRAAFYAYKNWAKDNVNVDKKLPGLTRYSPVQLFFISYASSWCAKMTNSYAHNQLLTGVHSLPELRVKGPTSNFDEFERTFGCRPGQENSRLDKCTVW